MSGMRIPMRTIISSDFVFVAGVLEFLIDFRAQICIVYMRVGAQIIPCKHIKKGYPKIGALITWED